MENYHISESTLSTSGVVECGVFGAVVDGYKFLTHDGSEPGGLPLLISYALTLLRENGININSLDAKFYFTATQGFQYYHYARMMRSIFQQFGLDKTRVRYSESYGKRELERYRLDQEKSYADAKKLDMLI